MLGRVMLAFLELSVRCSDISGIRKAWSRPLRAYMVAQLGLM